ncbi:MAG TPA: DUF6455 family protein [Burkholderiales bacterium]|nr:DUF6455 family protein [Burkholderiales bacterium]
MQPFKSPTRNAEVRAELMGRMMNRLDVDLGSVAREVLGTRLRSVANHCRGCRQTDLCQRWLDGQETGCSYRDFCPNAQVFEIFRRN